MFKESLLAPLKLVWDEALHFKALPLSINIGVVKLIHKRGDKDQIGKLETNNHVDNGL